MQAEQITVGMLVSYEDMANPRRVGIVVETGIGWHASECGVRWEDGSYVTSDMRQRGWREVSPVD